MTEVIMMTTSINQYNPDYAVPPGWILEEHIEALGLSQTEFSRRCGCCLESIHEIIAGRGAIEPQLASKFGRETGLNEIVWLNLESSYRSKLAELGENAEIAQWAKEFPVRELVQRGDIGQYALKADSVARMLSFFDVWSVNMFQDKYGTAQVAYRHSPSFKSDRPALAAWLRLGEIEAERTEYPEYDRESFSGSLTAIRALTGEADGQVFQQSQRLCYESGVVLCFIKPFPGVALSGASYWLLDDYGEKAVRPVIQLSARHRTDDQLWFSLFHEAAHILLHSKKKVFVDGIRGKAAEDDPEECSAEAEADEWAQNSLIPRAEWDKFAETFLGSPGEVNLFAQQQGIAPGIVVGRLQHEGRLPWESALNRLKRNLAWPDLSA